MDWLAWTVLVVLAVASVLWLVRRFRSENRRLDGMIRDFNRENPRHEPALPTPGRRLADLRRRR
jgi:hypothetical protein